MLTPSAALTEQFNHIKAEYEASQDAAAIRQTANETARIEQEKINTVCSRMIALAERFTPISGSHIHLGRDALVREYYSDWVDAAEANEDGIILQLQLERIHDIRRNGTIETGQPFSYCVVNLRLKHSLSERTTNDEPLYYFFRDKVTSEIIEEAAISPGLEPAEWEKIEAVVDLATEKFRLRLAAA